MLFLCMDTNFWLKNQLVSNYSQDLGLGTGWAYMVPHEEYEANTLGNSTKTQGPSGRHDILDDHFSFWNWLKYVRMGRTLMSKYKAALAECNRQI